MSVADEMILELEKALISLRERKNEYAGSPMDAQQWCDAVQSLQVRLDYLRLGRDPDVLEKTWRL